MSNLAIPIAVGLGGFTGALGRFYISAAITRICGAELSFLGTLTVNLIGCFAIGVLTAVVTNSTYIPAVVQKCLIVGLLGSLTTFSSFALDSLNLLRDGRVGAAIANVSINLLAGVLLVWLGMLLTGVFIAEDPVMSN